MGRLIDADNLRAQIEAHEIDTRFTLTSYEYGYNTGLEKAEDEVDFAKTVEAIPVDWLMKKADSYYKNNCIFSSIAIRSAVDAWKEEQKEKGE